MASITIIGGDFHNGGIGYVRSEWIHGSNKGLGLPKPGSLFKKEFIHKDQIAFLGIATEENLKKMTRTAGWPIEAVNEALANRSKSEVFFALVLCDGREALGKCDTKQFAKIEALGIRELATMESKTPGSWTPTPPNPVQPVPPPPPATVQAVTSVPGGLCPACTAGKHYACESKTCTCECHTRPAKPPASGKSAFVKVLVCFLFFVFLFHRHCGSTDSTPTPSSGVAAQKTNVPSSNDESSDPGVKIATKMISNDFVVSASGGDSVLSMAEMLPLTKINFVTSALQYEDDYNKNEIAADNKYKGQKLLVTGRVDAINKDALGDGYFRLRGSNPYIGVQATLKSESLGWAQGVKRGEMVAIVCKPGIRMATIAELSDCEAVDEFMGENEASLRKIVKDALAGRTPLSPGPAKFVAVGYLLGTSLPANSPCFVDLHSKPCQAQIDALLKSGLDSKADAVMANMKIQ